MCLSSPRGEPSDAKPVAIDKALDKLSLAPAMASRQQAPPDMDVGKRTQQKPTTVSLQRECPGGGATAGHQWGCSRSLSRYSFRACASTEGRLGNSGDELKVHYGYVCQRGYVR